MPQKSNLSILRKRSILVGIAACLVLVGIIFYNIQSQGLQLATNTDGSAKITKTNAVVPEAKTAAPMQNDPIAEDNMPKPNTSAPEVVIPETENNTQQSADKSTCSLNEASRVQAYKRDVRRERSDLEHSLEYTIAGVTQIRRFVALYNDDVTRIFELYDDEFKKAGCEFPVSGPDLLDSSYPD